MTLQKLEEGIFVDNAKFDKIRRIDSVVFDCDGVLIDIRNSYDLTIKTTVHFILKNVAMISETRFVTTEMIEGFKSTGGFNDEVDTSYALILSIYVANKLDRSVTDFIFEVIKNADYNRGIESVEKYLESCNVDFSEIKKKLEYPGSKTESLLNTIFDELFYGTELFQKLYKKKPKFFEGKGLIDNDRVLVTKGLLDTLRKKFQRKIAIVSGRGFVSAKHSLGDLIEEFDLANSRFLEDEPRDFAKPSPKSLLGSIRGMNSQCCLFVGDSMEDYIMAKEAEKNHCDTVFCGIFGTSNNPEQKRGMFQEKEAEIIVENIRQIPKVLNLV